MSVLEGRPDEGPEEPGIDRLGWISMGLPQHGHGGGRGERDIAARNAECVSFLLRHGLRYQVPEVGRITL